MRYRLRTLLIAVSVAAVIAATAGALLRASRPVPILASASGRQAIDRLSAAKSVRINVYQDSSRYDVSLSPDGKRQLVDWLSEGVSADSKKYLMSGTIKLEPPTDTAWHIMDLNSNELGLQVAGDIYWRGLSRSKFEELVIRESASADNRPDEIP